MKALPSLQLFLYKYMPSITSLPALRSIDGSLRHRMIDGATWSVIGAVLSRSLTLVAMVITARVLGAEQFGLLSVIQSTLGLFGVLAGAGLGLSVTKFVAQYRTEDPSRSSNFIVLSISLSVISGMVMCMVLYLSAPWLASTVFDAVAAVGILHMASTLVLFGALNGVQVGAMIGIEDFKVLSIMYTFRSSMLLIGMGMGAVYFQLSGAVGGMVIAEAASASINQLLLRRSMRLQLGGFKLKDVDYGDVSTLVSFSIPALLGSLATQPSMWISNVLLARQPGGYHAVGIYVAADKWRQLILFLPTSLSSIILPMLTNIAGSRDLSKFRSVFRLNLTLNLVLVTISAILTIFMSTALMMLYGSDYKQGQQILVILCLSSVFIVLNNVFGQVLISLGRIWLRFALDTFLSVIIVVLSFVLIPRYLALGLAVANFIAFASTALLLMILVTSLLQRDLSLVQEKVVTS